MYNDNRSDKLKRAIRSEDNYFKRMLGLYWKLFSINLLLVNSAMLIQIRPLLGRDPASIEQMTYEWFTEDHPISGAVGHFLTFPGRAAGYIIYDVYDAFNKKE
ncbi:MAG: hypothetical protein AABW49_00760 [Nanoarchaeota archaeon]